MAIKLTNDEYLVSLSTAVLQIDLDTDYRYNIYHTGLNSSDAAATALVAITTKGGTPVATRADGINKLVLKSDQALDMRPGIESIKLIAASGAPQVIITAIEYVGNK